MISYVVTWFLLSIHVVPKKLTISLFQVKVKAVLTTAARFFASSGPRRPSGLDEGV